MTVTFPVRRAEYRLWSCGAGAGGARSWARDQPEEARSCADRRRPAPIPTRRELRQQATPPALVEHRTDANSHPAGVGANPARGVGRALTDACLSRARAEGRKRLVLHTGSWMPAAIALYQKMGFARRPELDFAPAPGIDLIAYSFELEGVSGEA